ncbi:hypothetical protein [Acaryochloris sp. IP29b_bin.148]|uniref:hypothetical protein n=1 Tax=Acaryochloris sp. IP29b_bin.148 TaxID=2969218 RepID=UPI00262BE92C|nr:hypothetical protein [Acaryochloris sp. IP29b_bin.148]
MEELEQELETLRQENTLLQGLMTGGYAYFLHHFMVGHQSQMGLTADACEKIVIDALKRVLSTQNRFDCEYLSEIEAILNQMTTVVPIEPYLQQIPSTDDLHPPTGEDSSPQDSP